MAKVDELLKGYKRFYAERFIGNRDLFTELAHKGQSPKSLIIGCSDARVDPAILTDAGPGDIFSIRNVANLVPPYQPDNESYHGTSAAIEFAVNILKVEHIIVLGHSGCAGIKALLDGVDPQDSFSFITSWVNIAQDAKDRTISKCRHSGKDQQTTCEKEGIITSIHNLMTFPSIKSRVEDGSLDINGWYFSLYDGRMYLLNEDKNFVAADIN